MADVIVKIFKGDVEVASETIASPVTAAEAKSGLRDTNAGWVGKLTEPNRRTSLLGKHRLTPGGIYQLHLQEQAGHTETATVLQQLVEGQEKVVSLREERRVEAFSFSQGKTGKSAAVCAAVSQLGLVSFTPGLLPARWPKGYNRYSYSPYQQWPQQISAGDEDRHACQLQAHLQQQLAALEVPFDQRGGYQLKDIRMDYRLSFSCSTSHKEYKFIGGADAVVVPYGELNWQLQTRVLVDWKTPASLTSVSSGYEERKLELLGSLHHSNHPAVVVSTDGLNFVIFQPYSAAVRYFQTLDSQQPGYVTVHDAMRFIAYHLTVVSSLEPEFSYTQLERLSAAQTELRQEAVPLLAAKRLQYDGEGLLQQIQGLDALPPLERLEAISETISAWRSELSYFE